jgi:Ca-activated chloride channel family protein
MRLTAAAVAVTLLSAAPAGQQVFRGTADVVSLSVTVADTDRKLVSGLDRGDFQIFEDGVLQEIATFAKDPQPIALSILLDTSTSMERKLPIAQEAASGFVRQLGPRDLAQIIDFDTHPEILQSFTSDKPALELAVRKTQVGGSTALYNALYIALTELKHVRAAAAADIRRQAIIVLSDGEDTSSLIGYEEVLDSAKRSEVSVYAVGLRSKRDHPSGDFNEAEYVLRTLSQETGGRVFYVDDVSQLPGIYQQISDELANQYLIGYVSKNLKRDGAWRRIVVRTTHPGTSARTKSGYFAPTGGR